MINVYSRLKKNNSELGGIPGIALFSNKPITADISTSHQLVRPIPILGKAHHCHPLKITIFSWERIFQSPTWIYLAGSMLIGGMVKHNIVYMYIYIYLLYIYSGKPNVISHPNHDWGSFYIIPNREVYHFFP